MNAPSVPPSAPTVAPQPPRPARSDAKRSPWILPVAIGAIGIVLGAVASRYWPFAPSTEHAADERVASSGASDPTQAESLEESTVEFAEDRWENAGIEVDAVASRPFSRSIRLTGKIAVNQDRLAHIYSMVEGSIESVSVSLGQDVRAQDVLTVIHSRDIGTAKLELFQAQLAREAARTRRRMQDEIAGNTRELLDFLRQGEPIEEVETRFVGRPMGDFREKALAAYSNYLKSSADVRRLETVADSGAIAGRQLLTAEANRNADRATFQSRIEQIAYDLETSTLEAVQTEREAEARVLVAETGLRILGIPDQELVAIDPAAQGEALSHYEIRAPFDGTVLSKHVVLHEQIRSDVMLLSLADLSTVWVSVDLFEEHLGLLAGIEGKTLRVRSASNPDRTYDATVFFTGGQIDEATRTLDLTAVVDNADRSLKPGTYVNVELPLTEPGDLVQVPLGGIQEHAGRKFVFVYRGDGTFVRRDVRVGEGDETHVVVTEGLEAGESIAMRGGFLLKSSMLAELMGEE